MNIQQLNNLVRSLGASALGAGRVDDILGEFPNLSPAITRGLGTGISILARVSGRVLDEITDRPTRLYFHHYRRLNHLLDLAAHAVTARLLEDGYEAVPIPASQTIDWVNQTGHISHKAVAKRAGLGWLGRNNLLVTPAWGSHVRLVTVLTDAPLVAGDGQPQLGDGCGKCTACVTACPAHALGESYRDYDRDLCLAKMKEICKAANIGHYICGICVKPCRGNQNC